jgi:hypothetical protein
MRVKNNLYYLYYDLKPTFFCLFEAPTTSKITRKISSFVYFLPFVILALASYIFWDKMPVAVQNSFEKILGTFSSAGTSGQATSGSDEVWDGTMGKKQRASSKKRA